MATNKTIKITIESTAGAGRNCLAFAIAEMLEKRGIKCSMSGVDGTPLEPSWSDTLDRVFKDADRVIKIHSMQLPRVSKNK